MKSAGVNPDSLGCELCRPTVGMFSGAFVSPMSLTAPYSLHPFVTLQRTHHGSIAPCESGHQRQVGPLLYLRGKTVEWMYRYLANMQRDGM